MVELGSVGNLPLELPFIFDLPAVVFAVTVSLIRSAVFIFSSNYILGEKYFTRFHTLVLLFIGSIFMLIFSPSVISVLLGWDGLGVTSFLLVIYFFRTKSLNAGLLTALTNRIGDCLILTALAL